MLDVASRLADDKQNDIRIEAAIAKLYGSEMGWRVIDELMQIRGGRGYETAASLKARGEKPVPVEQALRDMRINRIFEGSTEIMHLLIAREAVDQHLQVAGDLLEPETPLADKARAAGQAGAFYATLAAAAGGRRGPAAGLVQRVRRARRARAVRRAVLAQARALDVLRDDPLAGGAREAPGVPGTHSSTSAPSCSRSPRRCVYAQTLGPRAPRARASRRRARRAVLPPGPPPGRAAVPRAVGQRRRRQLPRRPRACSTGATDGSRRGSSTPRARAR